MYFPLHFTRVRGGASGRESTCQCRRCRFDPWVGKIPCWRKWQPTPVFFARKSHRQRSLAGHSPWGRKESDTTEQLNNNSLLLPWKNNWTGFKETLCVFVYNSRIMESKGFRSRKTLPCNPLFLRGVHWPAASHVEAVPQSDCLRRGGLVEKLYVYHVLAIFLQKKAWKPLM